MRRVWLILTMLVLAGLPSSAKVQRDILGDDPNIAAVRVPLDASDPAWRQVGALTYLGGVALSSRDEAFGGFSSLSVTGDRFTLLSDGGNIVRFRMDGQFRVTDPWLAICLPDPPRAGKSASATANR